MAGLLLNIVSVVENFTKLKLGSINFQVYASQHFLAI